MLHFEKEFVVRLRWGMGRVTS